MYITTSTEKRIRYSVTMRTVQSWTCELGYGADTMFHRTYFLFEITSCKLITSKYMFMVLSVCYHDYSS